MSCALTCPLPYPLAALPALACPAPSQPCHTSLPCPALPLLCSYPTWPFRPDIPYIRIITAIQIIGSLCCLTVIAFGLLYSTSKGVCSKGEKQCGACWGFINVRAHTHE